MVNFGGHLLAVRAEDAEHTAAAPNHEAALYLVPYNEIKQVILEQEGAQFATQWREALQQAETDTTQAMQALWQSIFAQVHYERGCLLGRALELYVQTVDVETARQTMVAVGRIHARTITNSEALRKLVKKYDKRYPAAQHLSTELLPLLYASPVFVGQAMLQNTVTTLRAMLEDKDARDHPSSSDDDDAASYNFLPMQRMDSDAVHRKGIEAREDELVWLRQVISSVPETILGRLVAHRGFHHISDRNDKRPLENSLSAYELAWTSGIHLCECDIALTKDEKLVLAHDEDFQRLALESYSANSSKRVSDLTFRELLSLPLKSGIRPPLLIDVLRSAHAISDTSQLIIEIKPGNPTAASALARLLLRHSDLSACVAMIMSFDSVIMHRLHAELSAGGGGSHHNKALLSSGGTTFASSVSLNGQLSSSHRRYQSFDHFGTMASPRGSFVQSSRSHDDSGNVGLGLDISDSQLQFGDQNGGHSALNLHQQAPGHDTNGALPSKPIPKLMLLTVADEPNRPCEMRVGVDNLTPAESWLKTADGGSLDGVYLQFQPDMMTPEGAASLRQFSQQHMVGIWGYSGKDPDDYSTFHWLVQEGNVSFVNTDLPTTFRKGIFKRMGTM